MSSLNLFTSQQQYKIKTFYIFSPTDGPDYWNNTNGEKMVIRKKPSIQRYYNPQPPDYKACAIPLCYNHCPKCILMLLIPRLFFCSEWDIAKQNCWSVGTRDFSGDMAPRQANMFQPTARLSHLQRHLMAFKMVSCKSPQLHIYIHFYYFMLFRDNLKGQSFLMPDALRYTNWG